MGDDFPLGFQRAILMLCDNRLNQQHRAEQTIEMRGLGTLDCRLVEPSWSYDHSLNRTDTIHRNMLQGTSHAIAYQESTDDHRAGYCNSQCDGYQQSKEVNKRTKNQC